MARIIDSKVKDDIHTYYSTIRNQKFKIKGLPNHRIKMIYEDGKEEEKKESYFKELLQKQIIRIVDSRVEDNKITGKKRWEVGNRVRYEGRWYYIISYSRGDWVLEPENGNRVDCIYVRAEDSKIGDDSTYVYKLTKKKNDYDEYTIKAYKNGKYDEDATYYTDDWQDALDTLKSMAKREGLNFRQQGSVYIADSNERLVDQRVKDSEWSNDWADLDALGIDDRDKASVDAYFKKLASKYGVSYVRTVYYSGYPSPTFRGNRKNLEKLILKEYVGGSKSDAEEEYELIEDSVTKDSKINDDYSSFEKLRKDRHSEMTVTDALKVLNAVNTYKKIKAKDINVNPKDWFVFKK